jgi:hypothetical protein
MQNYTHYIIKHEMSLFVIRIKIFMTLIDLVQSALIESSLLSLIIQQPYIIERSFFLNEIHSKKKFIYAGYLLYDGTLNLFAVSFFSCKRDCES